MIMILTIMMIMWIIIKRHLVGFCSVLCCEHVTTDCYCCGGCNSGGWTAKRFYFPQVEVTMTIIHLDNDISAICPFAWFCTVIIKYFLSNILTRDCYFLPNKARSKERAEQGTSRKLLVGWGWKFIGDVHIDIFGSIGTTVDSVEDLNSLDGNSLAKIQCKPRMMIFPITIIWVAYWPSACVPINAIGSSLVQLISGWKGCWHRCQLLHSFCSLQVGDWCKTQ